MTEGPFTILDGDRTYTVPARIVDGRAQFPQAFDRPVAVDVEERVAYLGVSAAQRIRDLTSLHAPDFTLPDLDGRVHSLSEQRGKKVFLVVYASWCGCGQDLPAWQTIYDELKGFPFTVVTVALDKSFDDARPCIERAKPSHPSLIDTKYIVADLYNIINVPTIFWIDEQGRIVRPNDVAFGDDTYIKMTGLESERHKNALRAWVKGTVPPFTPDETRRLQKLPTEQDQQARAEFGLGRWLWEHGRAAAAERHFVRGGELAPQDFTIRRGAMRMRGLSPFGPEWRAVVQEWYKQGNPYYRPLHDTAGRGQG